MVKNFDKSWAKFLDPESLQHNVKAISLFICVFEMFKDQLVEKLKMLFSTSECFDSASGKIIYEVGQRYKDEVSSWSKYKDEAALLWFRSNGAVNDDDIEMYHKIRMHRNDLTHDMIGYVTKYGVDFDEGLFESLVCIYSKIEKWWFVNFELSISPEMLPDGQDPDDVIPGSVITINLMRDILLGSEPEKGYYYDAFLKFKDKK